MKKNIIILILSIAVVILGLLLWRSYTSNDNYNIKPKPANTKVVPKENPYKGAHITTIIIPSENNTFGYDISINGAVLVHQSSRPGMSGNKGFDTKEQAQKVADLVIKKIRNNEMPPTVTMKELEKIINSSKCK